MAHVQHHPAIIGWQLDNETKHYDNIGRYMQEGFVRSLQEKYPDLRQLNHDFGTDYWSNRIDRWQDFPPVENTINASLACAFSRYQRQQVTEYLAAGGHRSGIRPAAPVRHPQLRFRMARLLLRRAAAGRPFCGGAGAGYRRRRYLSPESGTPDRTEIAFGGAITRSLKPGQNYFVLETRLRASPSGPLPGPATPAGIQPYRLRRRHGLLLALAFDS